jgi:RsiW-degrading membrane proteinase PrsW (M82 family)
MNEMILLALAVAPGLALAFYVYERDKLDREPLRLLVISFLLGAVSIFPALCLETTAGLFGYSEKGLHNNHVPWDIFIYTLVVGFSEEFSKFIFVRWFAYPKKEFNEPFDGITYGVMVALGFATLENIFYVVQGGYGIALLRMFTAVPGHACFGVLMGYFIGLAKFRHDTRVWLKLTGLLSAVAFHTAYDFFLFVNSGSLIVLWAFMALAVGIRLSMRAIYLHQHNSPFKNPSNQTNSPPVHTHTDFNDNHSTPSAEINPIDELKL